MKPIHFAVDLNGTLVGYDKYRGDDHVGQALPGAVKWVNAMLAQGHKVTVFTTRTNFQEIQDALVQRGFPRLPVTNIKKTEFTMFIDDRAIRFTGPKTWTDLFFADQEMWDKVRKPWWRA
jgi:hypothetical protein